MKFINLTRHTEIGANSYYLESGGARLILDCGMHPKDVGENVLPNWKPIERQTIDAVLITHAHQDHIGTLPVFDAPPAARARFHDGSDQRNWISSSP